MTRQDAVRDLLRIVIVGHVDHGKSTLVGRLFNDTGSLPEGKLDAIRAMCERRGMPFEWAFLMDSLQSERDQGITIDTSQIWFKTARRDYTIIDAPGHREFIKNMITGAANADAAVMLIDASQGVQQQSRTHAYLLRLLGVRQIIVVVNKMDLVGFSAERFAEIEATYRHYLGEIDLAPAQIIPIVARDGDNIVEPSTRMAWYQGPTLVSALDDFTSKVDLSALPLRFPIQDVYKFDERRILAGRIQSGSLRVGDKLLFSPSNKMAHVASIETWSAPAKTEAAAGESVGITLDEQLFIERGDVASHEATAPIETNVFNGRLFWLSRQPLRVGQTFRLRLLSREVPVTVQEISALHDVEQLTSNPSDEVPHNGIAEVVLRAQAMLALDRIDDNPNTGRFVLTDGVNLVAGGTINMHGYPDQRASVTRRSSNLTEVEHKVTADLRRQRNGHRGGILWFTGLSGAGKSTIAMAVERELFRRGLQVYVLDGDNIRNGLSANLSFAPEDRAENIRRVGEVAALFADAGTIAITAFISPYRADRQRARSAARDCFHEIYIKADLVACETRDPKGLYQRARRGEIAEFTGISAPYEAPDSPDLVIDTQELPIEDCVTRVIEYVEQHFRF